METKEKNKKLLIVVGVLLLFGGVSLAYFVSKILTNGNGGNTSVTTAVINGATVNVEGVLSFEDLDILPGHKSVSSIKVTATGNNELIPYNLIWQGTNTLTTPLEFTIYKTSERIEVKATCEDKSKMMGSSKAIYEECNISNTDKLGTEIATGVINKNETKVTLAKDEFITASPTGQLSYYYIILEYPNLDEPQNYDLEGVIEGEVTVEESNIKPDINIIAAYIEQEDGTYKEVEDIPQEGYTINQEKSICSNGATPVGDIPDITVKGLTKSGTSCYLYFDEMSLRKTLIKLGISEVNEEIPDFSQVATTNEGIYKTSDSMYGGESYYWRGAVNNNYVKFAGYCWRIIRINGDGSIRLIYDGATCHANGTSTVESIAIIKQTYNANNNNSSYVGYTYEIGSQRPTPSTRGVKSNLKVQTDDWYNENIENNTIYNEKVADGKYCNDRRTQNDEKWLPVSGAVQYYASNQRLNINKQPSLECSAEDVYTLKAGAITADEIAFAGGVFKVSNKLYYLYNGQHYWTMTPYFCSSVAHVLYFYYEGGFNDRSVNDTSIGIRPVINLKSNITIFSGDGTQNNPFVVAD